MIKSAALSGPSEQTVVSGTARIPVILVDFLDEPAEAILHRPSDYHDLLFQKAYPYGNGSMRDYFLDQSGGIFDVTGEVTPMWLRLPRPYGTYVGTSFGYQTSEPNDFTLVRDAVSLADPLMNFCDFDTNSDGLVDSLFIVHAGAGAEETQRGLWSVKWSLPTPQPTSDTCAGGHSVSIDDFTIEPEEYTTSSFTPEGAPPRMISVGIFCHEFGHVLGLPDLYDTDYSSPGGVGPWDVMALGTYGFDGRRPWRPTPLSVWSKALLGWARPQNVTQDLQRISIPAAESAHEGPFTGSYKLAPGGNSSASEYLLVENRQALGWATDFPTSGLAIWHVDASRSGNADDSRRLLSLVQADGLDELGEPGDNYSPGDAGDLFPGTTGNRGIDQNTAPSTDFSTGHSDLAVWRIGDPGAVIVADFYLSPTERPPISNVVPDIDGAREEPVAETTPTPVVTPFPTPLDGVQPRTDELAPAITRVFDRPDPFAPGATGYRRRVVIHFRLSENAAVTVSIRRRGSLIRHLLKGQPRRRGQATVVWSGRNRSQRLAREGAYVYVIEAVDAAGNRSRPVRGRVTLRRA